VEPGAARTLLHKPYVSFRIRYREKSFYRIRRAGWSHATLIGYAAHRIGGGS
jgi:hypothetical protein